MLHNNFTNLIGLFSFCYIIINFLKEDLPKEFYAGLKFAEVDSGLGWPNLTVFAAAEV